MEKIGKWMMLAAIVLFLLGAIFWLFSDKLRFLGRMPGDIRIERGNIQIYIPVTTMLLISALLSFLFWLIQRFR